MDYQDWTETEDDDASFDAALEWVAASFAEPMTVLQEGGKGSGIRGHRTAKKLSLGKMTRALRAEESSIRLAPNEKAVVLNEDGSVLFEVGGTSRSVTFSREQMAQLKGKVVTHNHPGGLDFPEGNPGRAGSSFSKEDVALAYKTEVLAMRAVSPGYIHTLEIPSDFSDRMKKNFLSSAEGKAQAQGFDTIEKVMGTRAAVWRFAVEPKMQRYYQESSIKYSKMIAEAPEPAKDYVRGVAESSHSHDVMALAAAEFGWNYARQPWKE